MLRELDSKWPFLAWEWMPHLRISLANMLFTSSPSLISSMLIGPCHKKWVVSHLQSWRSSPPNMFPKRFRITLSCFGRIWWYGRFLLLCLLKDRSLFLLLCPLVVDFKTCNSNKYVPYHWNKESFSSNVFSFILEFWNWSERSPIHTKLHWRKPFFPCSSFSL